MGEIKDYLYTFIVDQQGIPTWFLLTEGNDTGRIVFIVAGYSQSLWVLTPSGKKETNWFMIISFNIAGIVRDVHSWLTLVSTTGSLEQLNFLPTSILH